MRNVKGFSLPELLTAVAVGGLMSLALASVFTFGAQQFNALIDQNQAEESFLLTSYYLRSYIAQAVKVQSNNNPWGVFTGGADMVGAPSGVPQGYFNCNLACTITATDKCDNPGWNAGINAVALFARDNGGNGTSTSLSDYMTTGIFYAPPAGAVSGKIYLSQFPSDTGGAFILSDTDLSAQLAFDKIVALGLYPDTAGNACDLVGTNLRSVNLYLRARYFKGISPVKTYTPNQTAAVTAGANFRDLEQTINIVFRNNVLGASTTSTGVNERVNGGLYFFKYQAPPMNQF